MISNYQINTPIGFFGVLWNNETKKLKKILLPSDEKKVGDCREIDTIDDLPVVIKAIVAEFLHYFRGRKPEFSLETLDLEGVSPFKRRVYENVFQIPWGQTRSYSAVATAINAPNSPRAVGHAMATNIFPIIVPCHRVISQNGKLCGYRDGLASKRYLLALECDD